MRTLIVIVCTLALHTAPVLAAAPQAASPQPASPVDEAYEAFLESLKKGDLASADRAAETAWRAAEKAGKVKESAILAYNLAELRLRFLPDADAVTPALRAYALARGNPDTGLATARVLLLAEVARYVADQKKQNRRNKENMVGTAATFALSAAFAPLRFLIPLAQAARTRGSVGEAGMVMALKLYDKAGIATTYPVLRADIELMKDASLRNDWLQMRQYALAAQQAYLLLHVHSPPELAGLKLMGALALVHEMAMLESAYRVDRKKRDENLKKAKAKAKIAEQELSDVFDIMGPQPQKNIHPLVLKTMALLSAVQGFRQAIDPPSGQSRHEARKKRLAAIRQAEEDETRIYGQMIKRTVPSCPRIEWVRKHQPLYTTGFGQRGGFGAAVIMYSLDEKGKTRDVRAVAVVPLSGFSETAMKYVRFWRARPMKGVPAACRENLLAPFIFSIKG